MHKGALTCPAVNFVRLAVVRGMSGGHAMQ